MAQNIPKKRLTRLPYVSPIGYLSGPYRPIIGFGGLDTSGNPEIIEMNSFGLSHEQIEQLLYQIEAESFPGAFKPINSINLLKKLSKKYKKNA